MITLLACLTSSDPCLQPMSDSVGSAVGGQIEYWVGTAALPGLSDDIALDLTRSVSSEIGQALVPALAGEQNTRNRS